MTIKELALCLPAIKDEAKQLWGDKTLTGFKCEHCGLVSSFQHIWKHHLNQMILSDDPEQYLEENT